MIGASKFSNWAAAIAAAALGLAALAAPAQAQSARVSLTGAGVETLNLGLGHSAIVELPRNAQDVLISNPEVADAIIRTPRRVYVIGVAVGQTNAFFFDGDGDQIVSLQIRVERDVNAIQSLINRLLPDANVQVEALNDNIVLSGVVESTAQADQAVRVARSFVENEENVISLLNITGGEQVLLRVRIVEMQRTVARQLGVNLGATFEGEDVSFGVATANEFSLFGGALGGLAASLGYSDPTSDFRSAEAVLRAMERVGMVRTLAEPNLTAITGEAAEFLSGGEFPVPVGRDNEGNVIIEYKPFGVGLSFTPMVLSDGRISLAVSTEVSELTTQGALSINGGLVDTDGDGVADSTIPGLTLPALNVRRAQTTVEMPSGGSLVMAGLIQDTTRQNVEGVPGARNVPGAGALFRARDMETEQSELIVIVTPYLVNSTHPDELQTPADGYGTPSEAESIFFGRLSRVYEAPGADTSDHEWSGPAGFVLDETQ